MDRLTTDEASDYLRIQKQTMALWRLKGTGPAYIKLGNRVFYRRDVLERFMAERERQSTGHGGRAAAQGSAR